MDLELNSEGGSGGYMSVCSDQLFDACGAEPVLDLPDGGVVAGRSHSLRRDCEQLAEIADLLAACCPGAVTASASA